MTDPPQEIVYRRINLLGSMIVVSWLVFPLALAMVAILLYGKARLTDNQMQKRLDDLSLKVTDLTDSQIQKKLADLSNKVSDLTRQLAAARLAPPPASQPGGAAGATIATAPPDGVPTPPPVAVAGPVGPEPPPEPGGTTVAAGTTSQPDSGGYHVSPVDGLLGPDANRPAGLAGWFYDIKTSSSPDEQNPMLLVVSGPRTVATALGEIAKSDPATAARQKIPVDDQVTAAQLFLQTANDEQAHRWASAIAAVAPRTGRAWLIAGLASARLKQFDDATAELTRAADLLPGRPEPLKALGEIHARTGKLDLAVADYRKAVAAVPADLGLALRLADLLVRARQVDEAVKQLRLIVTADPKLSVARAILANLLLERDRAKEAVDLLDAAPANTTPDIRLDLARGRALIGLNDLAGAEAVLEKMVDQTPISSDGWYLLGLVRVKQHKNGQAAVALERSIAIESTFAPAWQYLGLALANEGRLDDAIAKLQEAIRLNVSSAEMHYLLAVLYVTKKQPPTALAPLKEAVKLDPAYLDRARGEDIFKGLPADSAIAKFLKDGK